MWAVELIKRSIPCGYLLGSGSLGSSAVLCGIPTTEEVDGIGNRGSGDNTMVDVQTLLESFLNMSMRCVFH